VVYGSGTSTYPPHCTPKPVSQTDTNQARERDVPKHEIHRADDGDSICKHVLDGASEYAE